MRSALNVTLGFGLASIPVGLAKMADDDDSVSFRTLHAPCSTPVKEKRWCPACDVEVGEDVLKGFEIGGSYILFKPGDIEAAKPITDKVVRIDRFSPMRELLPAHLWMRHYLLLPDKTLQDRYAALLDALILTD